MSGYTPSVGDKVRATLGESVIAGPVLMVEEYPRSVYVEIDVPPADTFGLTSSDGWQFEQVVSVPSKFGAVIRRADGVVFVRPSAVAGDDWFGNDGKRWRFEEEATRGGFTVLFDGVDE